MQVFFCIKPVFSKQASAPSKMAKFLGCDIPCLANFGVGDMAIILRNEKVGVTLDSFNDDSLLNGLNELLTFVSDPQTKARFIQVANKYFPFEQGVRRYEMIYQSLD